MKILFLLLVVLTNTFAYSQNKMKYEMSVSIQLIGMDTIQIIPNGSADFISKIKTYTNGDTLNIKVFRRSKFAMLFSWTNLNKLRSKERQIQMSGILILHPNEIRQINYLRTYEHIWMKSINSSLVKIR